MADDTPDFAADGMVQCENCKGWFFAEDMDGDHCHECVGQLFGDFE